MGRVLLVFLGIMGFLGSCRTPYDPEIPATELQILVVEGYLDTEGKTSELKLSRTVPLSSEASMLPELGATVMLRGQNGQQFDLTEKGDGIYLFERNIDESQTYVLEILLRSGERFTSEELKPIVTPEILDGGFLRDEDGVEVFVSTQGNAEADDFLWTYEETWIYRPGSGLRGSMIPKSEM